MARTRSLKDRLASLKHTAEAVKAEVHAIATGVGPVLKSGAVVRDGGLKGKVAFVRGIAQYGFTTSRQAWYAAEVAPERTAIIDDSGEVTYRQLRTDVLALARALTQRGHGKGARMGVMARNGRGIIYPLAAKGFAGTHIYLLNVASSPTQLKNSIEEHNLDVLFIDEEFAGHLPADWDKCDVIIAHSEDLDHPKAPNSQWPGMQQLIDQAPSAKELKLSPFPKRGNIIIMSSGTSGTPKGVLHRDPVIPTPLADLITMVPWKAEIVVQQLSLIHI